VAACDRDFTRPVSISFVNCGASREPDCAGHLNGSSLIRLSETEGHEFAARLSVTKAASRARLEAPGDHVHHLQRKPHFARGQGGPDVVEFEAAALVCRHSTSEIAARLRVGLPVIDPHLVCSQPADYSNPI
jgi:hypothetical protein